MTPLVLEKNEPQQNYLYVTASNQQQWMVFLPVLRDSATSPSVRYRRMSPIVVNEMFDVLCSMFFQ